MNKLIFLLFILVFLGCSSNNDENNLNAFSLLSTTHSSCLGSKSAIVDDKTERFVISAIGDEMFKIEHQNVSFNCCLPEGIEMKAYVKNDTIFYSDNEKISGNCKCLCLYNTQLEVGGVTNGNHVLCFISQDVYVGSVELYFNENLNEEISISELADNE